MVEKCVRVECKGCDMKNKFLWLVGKCPFDINSYFFPLSTHSFIWHYNLLWKMLEFINIFHGFFTREKYFSRQQIVMTTIGSKWQPCKQKCITKRDVAPFSFFNE